MRRLAGGAFVLAVLGATSATASAQGFGNFANNLAPFGGFGARNPWGAQDINQSATPILNVFNGQTSLLQIQTFQWTPTNVQMVQSGGALAFVPQYQPLPWGLNMPVQAVTLPDGRFNRLNLAPTFQGPGIAPMFPVGGFATPMFAGGAQGMPTPFMQFLPQAGFNAFAMQNSVMVPNGGRAFAGGFNQQMNFRNQFGAPGLGGVPFLNQGFQQRRLRPADERHADFRAADYRWAIKRFDQPRAQARGNRYPSLAHCIMRILVTGGAGYIGSHAVRLFLAAAMMSASTTIFPWATAPPCRPTD